MELQDASPNRRVTRRSARAKINLVLAVDAPRPDGMHPICSWMARIDLADELTVTRLEDDRLSRYAILWHDDAPVKSPIDWSIIRDLAVRAHLLLEHETGRTLPVQMRLDKRIPVGGGLGGGSADAAAMLEAIDELFDLGIDPQRLTELALKLGSDVAFFLGAHSAGVVGGLGDKIEPTGCPSSALVLILPGFGCPTGAVYRAFDESPRAVWRPDEVRQMARSARVESERLFNDLADAAERVAPRLATVRARAAEIAQREVHITGSGSTMFIVCPEGMQYAEDLADDLSTSLAKGNEDELGSDGVRAVAASIQGAQ